MSQDAVEYSYLNVNPGTVDSADGVEYAYLNVGFNTVDDPSAVEYSYLNVGPGTPDNPSAVEYAYLDVGGTHDVLESTVSINAPAPKLIGAVAPALFDVPAAAVTVRATDVRPAHFFSVPITSLTVTATQTQLHTVPPLFKIPTATATVKATDTKFVATFSQTIPLTAVTMTANSASTSFTFPVPATTVTVAATDVGYVMPVVHSPPPATVRITGNDVEAPVTFKIPTTSMRLVGLDPKIRLSYSVLPATVTMTMAETPLLTVSQYKIPTAQVRVGVDPPLFRAPSPAAFALPPGVVRIESHEVVWFATEILSIPSGIIPVRAKKPVRIAVAGMEPVWTGFEFTVYMQSSTYPVTAGLGYVAGALVLGDGSMADAAIRVDWYNASGSLVGSLPPVRVFLERTPVRLSIEGVAPTGATKARVVIGNGPYGVEEGDQFWVDSVTFASDQPVTLPVISDEPLTQPGVTRVWDEPFTRDELQGFIPGTLAQLEAGEPFSDGAAGELVPKEVRREMFLRSVSYAEPTVEDYAVDVFDDVNANVAPDNAAYTEHMVGDPEDETEDLIYDVEDPVSLVEVQDMLEQPSTTVYTGTADENLVPNSSFEDATAIEETEGPEYYTETVAMVPTRWKAFRGRLYQDDTWMTNADASGRLESSVTSLGPLQTYVRSDVIMVTPGTGYITGADVRSDGTMSTASLRVDWYDSNGNFVSGFGPVDVTVTGTTYERLTIEGGAPSNASQAHVVIGNGSNGTSSGARLWIDNVSFVKSAATVLPVHAEPPLTQPGVTRIWEETVSRDELHEIDPDAGMEY